MVLSSTTCFCHSQFSLKTDCWAPALTSDIPSNIRRNQPASSTLKTITLDLLSQQVQKRGTKHGNGWSFLGGSRVICRPNFQNLARRRSYRVSAIWLPSSQVANSVFTLGTAAVLPFYTLMVAAPKAEILPGIAKMFSSEMTLASAWIHLLAVDLFAARQVHHDGLQNDIETRHSVSLCLLFCPIGIVIHLLTKAVLSSADKTAPRTHWGRFNYFFPVFG